MKKIVLLVLAMLVIGCSNGTQSDTKNHGEIQRDYKYQAMQRCLDTGGMPLVSAWDGSVMKSCQYPLVTQ